MDRQCQRFSQVRRSPETADCGNPAQPLSGYPKTPLPARASLQRSPLPPGDGCPLAGAGEGAIELLLTILRQPQPRLSTLLEQSSPRERAWAPVRRTISLFGTPLPAGNGCPLAGAGALWARGRSPHSVTSIEDPFATLGWSIRTATSGLPGCAWPPVARHAGYPGPSRWRGRGTTSDGPPFAAAS
jgi:hypothetical protein